MNDHEALMVALNHADIAFFGQIFDIHFHQLVDGAEPSAQIGDLRKTALHLALEDPTIATIKVSDVIEAVKSGKFGADRFSSASLKALEEYGRTEEGQETSVISGPI